jgi:general secretion pathway protein I
VNSLKKKKNNRSKGFTLLEVMIAMAILAVSLLVILDFQSTAVIISGRSQSVSVATSLARHQMAQLILQIEAEMTKGSLSDDMSEEGDFSDLGFPDYRWEMEIRKVEIPAPPMPEESGGEIVTKIIESITDQISRATREMKLTVFWKELEDEQSIDVTTHIVSLKGARFGVTGG